MDSYSRIRTIGEGSYGTAVLCEHKRTGRRVVVKFVSLAGMTSTDRRSALQEASLLASFHHPCIIGHVESFEHEGSLCIVCEFAENGDLSRYMDGKKTSRLPEDRILSWFVQICLAVGAMHERKILHRDLKLQNVFLDAKGDIKLGDFGIARLLKNSMECAKTVVGTPYYLSPEICESKPYNSKSDVWALGCILYELCSQRHPFQASSLPGLVHKILHSSLDPIPAGYSNELTSLVSALLSRDPSLRPPVKSLLRLPLLSPALHAFADACADRGVPLPPLAAAALAPAPDPVACPAGVGLCESRGSVEVLPAHTVRCAIVPDEPTRDTPPLPSPQPKGGSPMKYKPPPLAQKPQQLAPLELAGAKVKRSPPPRWHSADSRHSTPGGGQGAAVRVPRPLPAPPAPAASPALPPPPSPPVPSPAPRAIRHKQHCPRRHSSCSHKRSRTPPTPRPGKLVLGGETFQLPGVPHNAPLTHRLEALREYLSRRLGDTLFLSLYRLLNTAEDPAAAAAAAVGTTQHKDLLPLVTQLLQLEAVAF